MIQVQISEPEDEVLPDAKSPLIPIVLCLFAAMGGFVFGYDTGTISGFINLPVFLEKFGQYSDVTHKYYFSNVRSGLIIAIFSVGCFGGTHVGAELADRIGRRIGIMIATGIYIIGILIQITAMDKWYQYFVGRIVAGVAVGALSVLVPMFQSEASPKNIRGALVSSFQLFITLGIFVGYCVTFGTKDRPDTGSYRIPLGLSFLWALILIIGMVAMPESPRYLVSKDRIEDARRSVARTNKVPIDDPFVDAEVEEIQQNINFERLAGKASWGELVTGQPRIFYRLWVGIFIQIFQQLCGANYFFYYGTSIFQAVGMEDSFATSMIFGAVNFLSTFAGIYNVEKFGRRNTLIVGAAVMFACFLVFSTLGFNNLYPGGNTHLDSVKPVGNAMIFLTCLFIAAFAASWAPICYVVVSETYPLRIKSKGMAIATSGNWFANFLISFFTPFITHDIGFKYGYVFTGCCAAAGIFVYFFVPETKGLTLEQVDEMYESGVKPWLSSSWVPSVKPHHSTINDPSAHSYEKNEIHHEPIV
ncbi:general substrate transporter [Nadsonia fulvescens var. elongata DSM 6958]|uniref:General substrate transporter n=1 Tax=Nadsonia fulvescens var. elongata DSM 6958 TaxID=857566 RepID=A0A1E3PTG0_9ASCO|nr:general substrate transporter [Nadsonia fulvescens var. elongata DSM 6958]